MAVSIARCPTCATEKPVDEFYANRSRASGRSASCKDCDRARRREYGAANRERINAETRARIAADPEWAAKRAARAKDWRSRNPEQVIEFRRQWEAENVERRRELHRAYYEANKDWAKSWRARNPRRAKENELAYRLRTREAKVERQAARRAQKRATEIGPIDLDAIWTGSCGICSEPLDRTLGERHPRSKSIDHVIPLSKGGTHTQDNVQWAHLVCNLSKGNRVPEGRAG